MKIFISTNSVLSYEGTCKQFKLFDDATEMSNAVDKCIMVKPDILTGTLQLGNIPKTVLKLLQKKYPDYFTIGVHKNLLFIYDVMKDIHYFWLNNEEIKYKDSYIEKNSVTKGI